MRPYNPHFQYSSGKPVILYISATMSNIGATSNIGAPQIIGATSNNCPYNLEIWLRWTNVTSTYVAGTNDTLTVLIC